MSRGKTDNLKTPTSEEARERGRQGGIKSGQARRRKKMLTDVITAIFNEAPAEEIANKLALAWNMKPEDIDNQTAIVLAQIKRAMEGDSKAFELLRDTAGQNPVQKAEFTGANGTPLAPIKISIDFGDDD